MHKNHFFLTHFYYTTLPNPSNIYQLIKTNAHSPQINYNVVVNNAIEELKNIGARKIQLPPKFGDALSSFNEDVRKETKGLLVGSLLKGIRGRGKDLYMANIGRIMAEGLEYLKVSSHLMNEINEQFKKIEKRFEKIETDIKTIKAHLNIS